MTRPTILFLFCSSPYATQPWVDAGGYNVVTVDYDDTDHSDAHTGPVEGVTRLNIDLSQWDARGQVERRIGMLGYAMPSLVVSFPPCTDLAVSGAKHFASKLQKDPECQLRAVRMAQLASRFGCPFVVENPVSVLSTMWRKPDAITHPWYFAGYCPRGTHPEFPDVIPEQDRYNKKTCYWFGNGFRQPTPLPIDPKSGGNPGWEKLGGKSARTKYIRSLTPRGWAQAVYGANRNVAACTQYVEGEQLELDI